MTFLFFFAAPTTSIHVQQQPARSSETITRGRTAGLAEARSERDIASRASMTPDQVANRRARARERYANETSKQRQARRVRQNARNTMRRTTPGPNYAVGSGVTGTNNVSMVGSKNLDAADVVSSMVGSNNLDAIDVVYQNLPESIHMLK